MLPHGGSRLRPVHAHFIRHEVSAATGPATPQCLPRPCGLLCHYRLGICEAAPGHTKAPYPRPSAPRHPQGSPATGALTLLLGRRHRAPAFASRAAARLLGGDALWLQVLRCHWGWGRCVLPGGLMGFGDLLREAGRSENLHRLSVGPGGQGKSLGSLHVASLELRQEEAAARPGAHSTRVRRPGLCTEPMGHAPNPSCLEVTAPPSATPSLPAP